jgi:oligopeptide transport system substrate-binding protein
MKHYRRTFLLWLAACLLAACSALPLSSLPPSNSLGGTLSLASAPQTQATPRPTPQVPNGMRQYRDDEQGAQLFYPNNWQLDAKANNNLAMLYPRNRSVIMVWFVSPFSSGQTLQSAGIALRDSSQAGLSAIENLRDEQTVLADGQSAWLSEYQGRTADNSPITVQVFSAVRGSKIFSLMSYGLSNNFERSRADIEAIGFNMFLEEEMVFGFPRSQTLVLAGGESSNPRSYDPAHSGGDSLIYSGLVSLDPQFNLEPDLASGWEISQDGTVYTFYLRDYAHFHDGRPVTAQDVIYSWERAANPTTQSDSVLTYLGDIVGVKEMFEGKADSISGLKALDPHTLQVTIDAPKSFFLMKLTYSVAVIVDRNNLESGPEWYRTPNGTGPYKLTRWDKMKLKVYQRNDDYYLDPPKIPNVVVRLYEGTGMRMYEMGDIDVSSPGLYDLDRLRNPSEPMHNELSEIVSMCTSYITFDASKAPFDDPKVRQAFTLATDRQQYIDVVMRGSALSAEGILPPSMPGHNSELVGLEFNPELARQRLAESSYGSAQALPKIVFTSGGYGSTISRSVSALIEMWRKHLGVEIEVEQIEPNYWLDMINAGQRGQLFSMGWCADYPDPENFLDTLFHSGAQQNRGNYSNPEVDQLLEAARSERDSDQRMRLYQQAEQLIVNDAAVIPLQYSLSFLLTKPYLKGYIHTPIGIPIERYIWLDPQ